MIIYFDLQPEYRKQLAILLGSTENNLGPFYAALESEVAWHLALGGLQESDLSDDEILKQLKIVNLAVSKLDKVLDEMPPDLFGWLIDHAPVGLDYQVPFQEIKEPLNVIGSMTEKAVSNFPNSGATTRRSSSVDFVRKIAGCCEKAFGVRPDLESDLFYDIVETVFQSLGISQHKDIKSFIVLASRPPAIILEPGEEEEEDNSASIKIPDNYLNAIKNQS